MAHYTKERNIILIALDGNGAYKLDINTGVFYGKKGSPIKTIPNKTAIAKIFDAYRTEASNLEYTLRTAFDYCSCQATSLVAYAELLQLADKLDALGVQNIRLEKRQVENIDKYIKMLRPYLESTEGVYRYRDFISYAEFELAKKKLGNLGELLTSDMYHAILHDRNEVSIEELDWYVYYLVRGKYWKYHNGDLSRLRNYRDMCVMLEKKPEKVNNFMREYIETLELYELRKQEFDDKKLALNYAKHSKAWEFEYGDFTIVIPTTTQDIVTEGQRMHHCVGSYVNRVLENDTYICFVRKKDTPNDCYITCQVYTDGSIGQYFLAYDNYIREPADREFYTAFAKHLSKVWSEG